MAGPITTSIVISFSTTTDSILKAEIDDRTATDGGYNNGETSFAPGDEPVFLLYKSTNVTVVQRIVSEGTLSSLGTPTIRKVEQLQFAQEKSSAMSYPYVSGFSIRRQSPSMPVATRVGNTVNLAAPGVGIIEVEYFTQAEAIKVRGASGDLPVVVYVEGATS